MAKVSFNGTVIAESDDIEVVEGNPYFPISALDPDFVVESDHHTMCPWKGIASYWSIEVDGQRAENAAWYYPDPKPAAEAITDRVAFYRHLVKVEG